MRGGKNSEQKEDKRSRKVFSAVERVHSRRGYMGKKRESKECRRVDRRIQREDECRSKEIREINMAEERHFIRGGLPGKFTVKMLYGWDDGKFEEEYLRKLERNWRRWKAVSLEKKP